jgi:hypothetical protein
VSATATAAATSGATRVEPSPGRRLTQQSLRLVASPVRHLPGTGFAAFVVALLLLGLVGVLVLTTAMQQRADLVQDLTSEHRALYERSQSLRVELALRQSPAALAESARSLGMVPAGAEVFVDLDSGTVQDPTGALDSQPTP